jgi:hypothetical protein
MLDRIRGRRMRAKFRVEVAQNPYAGGIAHLSIVLERFVRTDAINAAWFRRMVLEDDAVSVRDEPKLRSDRAHYNQLRTLSRP